MDMTTISPEQLYSLYQHGNTVDLIDVRTPAEFKEVHAEGAQLAPLDAL